MAEPGAKQRIDEATGIETVGHEWDGIEELNNPLPRWWLLTFYASILFSLAYVIVYPAIPLLNRGTEGLWGWTSRGQLAAQTKVAEGARAATLARLAAAPLSQIAANPALFGAAKAGGKAAFRVNCVQCHGSEAAGGIGYPNLNDDDWLWGGNLDEIHATIVHGIRQPGDDRTRQAQTMPHFGRDGLLTQAEIGDAASYVRVLAGKDGAGPASARGEALFAANCAACHGANGKGNREIGAPNLTDAVWLYGGSRAQIAATITQGPAGVMPAWHARLDPVTIKMLAIYVHSLGGGEDFANATPAQAGATHERP